ncbi:MAG: DUF1326 domain-containing protein [Armatimonadetes bacterium]|nr:DUF1326 domain-containing protein [Armatimonadota bacterium]
MTTLLAAALLAATTSPEWRLQGELSEACSCDVPCTCNFNEAPGPHKFCWAIYGIDIKHGHFGAVRLDGLHIAGAMGEKGVVWYLDDRATKAQSDALRAIAQQVTESAYRANGATDVTKPPEGMAVLGYQSVHIQQEIGPKSAKLWLGDKGGFDQDYLIGLDGKTPIIVENNASWNITKGIKGKTKKFTYKDDYGQSFDFEGTNANQGHVDWSDKTKIYFK